MDFILEGSVSQPRCPVPIFAKLIHLWNLKQKEHIGFLLLWRAQVTSGPTQSKMEESKKIIIKKATLPPIVSHSYAGFVPCKKNQPSNSGQQLVCDIC
jgi:hypothetical protein